jgi:outer membrane biogenesis lipoprotein LolB
MANKQKILGIIVMVFILAGCTQKQDTKQQPQQASSQQPQQDTKQKSQEVTGIFWDGKSESYAIVDGEVVKVGDKIGEIEVLGIAKDYVEFKDKANIYKKQLTVKTSAVTDKAVVPSQEQQAQAQPQEQKQEHLIKARDYEQEANYAAVSYEERVELYNKAIEEYRLAIYETSGKERDEVNAAIEKYKEKVSRLERGHGDREKISNCNKYSSEAKYYRHTRQERIDYANRALDFCTDPLERETLLRIISEQRKAIDEKKYGPQQSDR